jgi:hypothetical protein
MLLKKSGKPSRFIDKSRKYGKNSTTIKIYYNEEESGGLRVIYEDNGVAVKAISWGKFLEVFIGN